MKFVLIASTILLSSVSFAKAGKSPITADCLKKVTEHIVRKLQAEESKASLEIMTGKSKKIIAIIDKAQIYPDLALMPVKTVRKDVVEVRFESDDLVALSEVQVSPTCQVLGFDMGQNDFDE